jgi:hypothetical protein
MLQEVQVHEDAIQDMQVRMQPQLSGKHCLHAQCVLCLVIAVAYVGQVVRMPFQHDSNMVAAAVCGS